MHKLLLVILLIGKSKQDLPIHCLKSQVVGNWEFVLEAPQQVPLDQLISCGHSEPDNEYDSYTAHQSDFQENSKQTFTLLETNAVEQDQMLVGKWTMVYDEGFDVIANNINFFAFNKYIPNSQNVEQDSTSDCGNTLVGWYNNKRTQERGCFKASKKGKNKLTQNLKPAEAVLQPKNTYQKDSLVLNQNQKIDLEADHLSYVETLNSLNSSWKADISPDFKSLSLSQLNSRAGRRHKTDKSNIYKERDNRNRLKNLTQIKSQFQSKNDYNLPKSFSWKEYINEPIQQKDCGSCYAIATSEVINARLKINNNKDYDVSVQQLLDCNYYNQGCEGGYGYLVNKFASEVNILPSKCKRYEGEDQKCDDLQCTQDIVQETYKIKDFGFIGGAYMESNEENIMKEMMENGPVVMSFEPKRDFMYYSGGIYKSNNNNENRDQKVDKQWEKVDHSVMCYGWGEENDEKYWVCLNSWGSHWGEGGSFRIIRGTDESHIESMGEYTMPEVESKQTVYQFLKVNSRKRK